MQSDPNRCRNITNIFFQKEQKKKELENKVTRGTQTDFKTHDVISIDLVTNNTIFCSYFNVKTLQLTWLMGHN